MPSKLANKDALPRESAGALYVVATPIGNLSDITLRALEVLRSVHRIAAEDTRHTRKLLSRFDIHKPLVSYHDHNAHERGPELLEKLRAGEDIALVTDAGTPGISDPGFNLVREAIERDLEVIVIPGPTALIAALAASGLPTHPFAFLGFPPNRGSGRKKFFASHAALPMTVILYESPQRLERTLQDLETLWGDRLIAVARELTKQHEEVFRGRVSEARNYFKEGVKGEICLVVSGAPESTGGEEDESSWRDELLSLMKAGLGVRDATDRIISDRRLPRRVVYKEALRVKDSL